MERATKKGMKYNFAYFIMICKTYKMPQPAVPSGGGRRKQKGEMEGRIFVNAEEEFFHEASKFESPLVVMFTETQFRSSFHNCAPLQQTDVKGKVIKA